MTQENELVAGCNSEIETAPLELPVYNCKKKYGLGVAVIYNGYIYVSLCKANDTHPIEGTGSSPATWIGGMSVTRYLAYIVENTHAKENEEHHMEHMTGGSCHTGHHGHHAPKEATCGMEGGGTYPVFLREFCNVDSSDAGEEVVINGVIYVSKKAGNKGSPIHVGSENDWAGGFTWASYLIYMAKTFS